MKNVYIMKSIRFAGIYLVLALYLGSCNSPKSDESTGTSNPGERIYPVKTEIIKKESITQSIPYTANLEAFEEVYFAPSSPGRIRKIHVEIGNRIKKGQLLIEMDPTQLNQAIIQLDNARSNFHRIDTLYKLGSIPEQQYEQVKTQYEVAKSNVEYLEENTILTSPVNGLVTGRFFENGELYSGAPNTQAGKAAILTLMQINPLKAMVSVSESYFPQIKENISASVSTDIYPGKIFPGRVYRIHPTIDRSTRTFKVELVVDNDNEQLRPGMFARVNIETGKTEAIVVPAISIIKQEGTNNRYVFLNDNGKAKKIQVIPGKRFDDKIELKNSAVKPGDELIIAGQASLMDGVSIKVNK